MTDLKTDIQFIKGVGPVRAESFRKAGIETIEDLLYRIPFRYEDRGSFLPIKNIRPGAQVSLKGKIISSNLKKTRKRGFTLFEAILDDGEASIKVVWINQPYLKDTLPVDTEVILFGNAALSRYAKPCLQIENPEYETVNEDEDPVHTGGIVPVYRNIQGVGQKTLRKIVHNIISTDLDYGKEFLPLETVKGQKLIKREAAFRKVHFPEKGSDVEALNNLSSDGHKRLVFEEFFLLQSGLLLKKDGLSGRKGISFKTDAKKSKALKKVLPFSLTLSQRRVFKEIVEDMTSQQPMNRLLQGDVGSGKTIVALLAMLLAVENGYQAAIMAPTEILAEQHFMNFRTLLKDTDYETALLTGAMKSKEKKQIEEGIKLGKTDIVVGTHALLQKNIIFKKLGLAVIDEQHRFGVVQRAEAAGKGMCPDYLIMTATPIPRTLALTVYGDLDLSVIDELPPGRTPVTTRVVYDNRRRDVYSFIKKNVNEGGQCFIVYPLIEESEKLDLKAATEMFEMLKKEFNKFRLGLLHGKMKSAEKDGIMSSFKNRKIDILVSTTVIEVGIDIPNSNIMVVENAERFGLAQLHQLRGRVGRGKRKSYCILMGSYKLTKDAKARLEVMSSTDDGFVIAEKDLEIRGPGDFFGTRQAGVLELRVGNIVRDRKIMEIAREEAEKFLNDLKAGRTNKNSITVKAVREAWKKRFSMIGVG